MLAIVGHQSSCSGRLAGNYTFGLRNGLRKLRKTNQEGSPHPYLWIGCASLTVSWPLPLAQRLRTEGTLLPRAPF